MDTFKANYFEVKLNEKSKEKYIFDRFFFAPWELFLYIFLVATKPINLLGFIHQMGWMFPRQHHSH